MENIKEGLGQINEPRQERLQKRANRYVKAATKEVNVEGKNNLDSLPKDRPVIFMPSHSCGMDMTATIASIPNTFNFKVVHAKNHEIFLDKPLNYMIEVIAGKDNFLPVSPNYIQNEYDRITEELKNGTNILMSGYYKEGKEFENEPYGTDTILPEKGGWGIVLLAQRTNAVIVPVGVSVDKKRRATINYGEYLNLEKIENIDNFRKDSEDTKRIAKKLREQSKITMSALAKLVPEERRGSWNENLNPSSVDSSPRNEI